MIVADARILYFLGMFMVDLFKPRRRLEGREPVSPSSTQHCLEASALRLRLCGSDRALLVFLTRLWPSLLDASRVVQPETILRWHRAGFKSFWRWKSRKKAGGQRSIGDYVNLSAG